MKKESREEVEKETDKTPETPQVEIEEKESEAEETPTETHANSDKQSFFKRAGHWLGSHKKVSIPVGAILVLGLLAAVPFTRYALAGMFVQQSFSVRIVDADTNKPVSSATVRLAGKQATTDNKGQATIRTNVGDAKLEVSKKYYQTTSRAVLVPFKRSLKLTEVKLKATGRTVPVKVLNKISGKAAANVTIKTEGTEAKTDRDGAAMLVVPADKKELIATVSGENFNSVEVKLQVTTDEVPANTFELTPSGKVYFLSNQSGKVDVVKTNLDGSERKTVLAGTGKEDEDETTLMISPDQKYMTLLSKRDGGDNPKLFLIDTSNDQLATMDEGNATFYPVGWLGNHFAYKVVRKDKKDWDEKREALKSYNAKTKKIILLDEVGGEGSQGNYFQYQIGSIAALGDEIVYSRSLYAYPGRHAQDREASINTVKADGSGKRKLNTSTDKHAFQAYGSSVSISYGIRLYNHEKLYFINHRDNTKLYEYKDGQVKEVPGKTAQDLYDDSDDAIMYRLSPDGKKYLWAEGRDGKTAILVSNIQGEDKKQIAILEEYSLIGWHTDNYILLNKKSGMYIIASEGLDDKRSPLKVSDYMQNFYY